MKYFLIIILTLSCSWIQADEGLWIPSLLKETCYDNMLEQGLLLSDSEIYSEDRASLKDAVVIFGNGCTGVIVSDEGLLFTNHHCAYSYVQKQSTVEHNYLENGFWAYNKTDELPIPALSVSVLIKMEDVTEKILTGISPDMDSKEREATIKKNSDEIINRERIKQGKNYLNTVKPLYDGNQYYLYCYEVFRDVRLVGVPPASIGKFGKDLDNWTWPRHTGDFAVFRIYANSDNLPVEYSTDNVPYHPKKSIPVSIRNVSDHAFSFVMGYPSYTHRFITSYELNLTTNESYPQRVSIYEQVLNIWTAYMKTDPQIQLQYATKYASESNAYQRLKGIISGVKQADGINKKRREEKLFMQKVASSSIWNKQYGHLMENFKTDYSEISKYLNAYQILHGGLHFIELFQHADKVNKYVNSITEQTTDSEIEQFLKQQENFYMNFNAGMDREIFVKMTAFLYQYVSPEFYPDFYIRSDKNIENMANELYNGTSALLSYENLCKWIRSKNQQNISDNDPVIYWVKNVNRIHDEKVWKSLFPISNRIDSLYRVYAEAALQVFPEKKRYPDANRTLRVSYGKIEGYSVNDTTYYSPYTDIDGLIVKAETGNEDYRIPFELKELYYLKDYGIYQSGNTLPTCFITTAHTSSGNSGSPVFNSKGELIGLNFDRNWEGTMSDVLYDPAICRNIVVDTRYILFVIDKYAKAENLLKELTIHADK
ncbi:MAG: S46 family peptidase [Dysgonamonadaceae bacterium]|jgi:hypothetical protein|nr:S46 family peptidase [Dysgonamonadaceae bacterium]